MRKFRIPEILLGVLLTIGVLSIGATVPGIYPKNQNHNANPNNATANVPAKDITDERIADYTEALAWFTLIMAGATIALFVVTWRASTKQSADMQEMRDIAEKQMNISALQTDIQKKQHAVARIQTLTTHRPKLRVRNIVIERPSLGQKALRFFDSSQPVKGSLEIVNIGGSAAKITGCYCSVWWNRPGSSWELPMQYPYSGRPAQAANPKGELAAGESMFVIFNTDRPPPNNISGVETVNGSKAFVMGWIEYSDSLDVRRMTRFCREYVAKAVGAEGRFRAVDDPDYEYED